jgi:hypothetical protein
MDLDTTINGIHDVRERIHKFDMWDDPVALSDVMTKLAVYNSYLADFIAPFHKQATDKAYKTFMEVRNDGGAIGQADITSRGQSTVEREIYENTLNVYRATDKLISVLQSRIKVAENQLKREGQM